MLCECSTNYLELKNNKNNNDSDNGDDKQTSDKRRHLEEQRIKRALRGPSFLYPRAFGFDPRQGVP